MPVHKLNKLGKFGQIYEQLLNNNMSIYGLYEKVYNDIILTCTLQNLVFPQQSGILNFGFYLIEDGKTQANFITNRNNW